MTSANSANALLKRANKISRLIVRSVFAACVRIEVTRACGCEVASDRAHHLRVGERVTLRAKLEHQRPGVRPKSVRSAGKLQSARLMARIRVRVNAPDRGLPVLPVVM